MAFTEKDIRFAKARSMAKKFRQSIPTGWAIKVPDATLDALDDEQAKEFMRVLREDPRLFHEPNGAWSRR